MGIKQSGGTHVLHGELEAYARRGEDSKTNTFDDNLVVAWRAGGSVGAENAERPRA